MRRVAVLGAGKMGQAIVSGLLRAGWSRDAVVATARSEERAAMLREQYGVRVEPNAAAVAGADVVVVAVKPQDAAALLDELAGAFRSDAPLVSICAGLPVAFFEKRLPDTTPVVRAMPNTPALVDEAMTVLSPGTHADERCLAAVEELFKPLGRTLVVDEKHQDAVTAISGSGPAYFYYLAEAMTEAGVLMGLPREVSKELVTQTALGAARMLRESGDSPVALREAVESPAGTTISAVRQLENHRARSAVTDAIEAARDRAREIADEYA
ncbi:pyrroline-5-carboxylate reductase [Glycomyces terrestris]|uniref:Pyrroline-5-carboxylate reductase n=1 Tax=Glycomyces terrestris TaxID=2493553 RepID=A0A426V1A3_9ACTN|nr:pyrroline-5-carboxylate reductase [Glycomyces terrestris]RRS00617.1 pyrroline-5-carboxylate reductase [Glycomyces terrestris]